MFVAGATLQWLRDGLGIIGQAAESQALADSVPDTGGVYFVPAFVGLGAPYWDMYARGTIVGLTRGTSRAHLVRAALEAIAYQSRDVLDVMTAEAGLALPALRVDGLAASNDFLCQFQADVLGVAVERPAVVDTTALGAAYLAGLGVGFWRSLDEIAQVLHHRAPVRAGDGRADAGQALRGVAAGGGARPRLGRVRLTARERRRACDDAGNDPVDRCR